MRLNGNLVLNSGGQSEIDNFIIERLSAAPSVNAAEKGRIYFNTTDNTYYYNNGTNWMAFATGGNAAALQTEVDNLETALGSAISASGTYVASAFTGYAAGATSLTEAISQIEAALTAHNTLAELDDVALSGTSSSQALVYNGSKWANHTLVLTDIPEITATASEVNQLAGSTVTTADLQKLHLVTASASELNILHGATLTTTELNYVDGVTSAIQTQLDNKQPLDAQLTSLAALAPTSSNRYIIGASAGDGTFNIVDAAGFRTELGVALGVDVQAYDADLATLANFAPVADSSETITINSVAVTHGGQNDIVVGTGGAEGSRWTLKRGASARTSLGLGNIAILDESMFVRADVAGNSNIATDISLNNYKLTNVAPGTAGTDAVNKNQLESAITGLSWKQAVVAATSSNVDLATGGLLTLDTSVILVDGNRVLVKSQTLAKENGIYVAHSGAWTRATDLDAASEFPGAAVLVEHGAQYALSSWVVQTEPAIVGTDPVVFAQFNGASGVVAGVGLSKTGNQLDVNLGAGIVELPTDEVGIDLYDPTSSAIILTTDATTRSTGTNAKLHLLLDLTGNGKLIQSSAGLKVDTNTITAAELTTSVAGNGLVGGAGTALAVVSDAGTAPSGAQDDPNNWAGVGTVVVTSDAVGVSLGSGATDAAPGTHTHKASAITFNNSTAALSGSPTTVQAALDIIDGRVDTIETNAANLLTEVNAIETSLGAYVTGSGIWATPTGTNYLNSASSVSDSLVKLDTQIKTEHTLVKNTINAMYYLYSGGANTTHSVAHNLGQQYCNVTVIDSTNEVIVPQSIVFDDANNLTVTLNVAIAIKVVVMGLAAPLS
jgi:hypothetical protein